MPRKPLETSQALASLLRRRRKELQFSLRDVAEQASRDGQPIPHTTLAKIEQGKVDPGVKRLHQLLKLYGLPLHVAGDLLDVESLASERPASDDPDALYREGLAHWKRGDTRRGLAHMLALREIAATGVESEGIRRKAALSFAIASASLGKFRLSLQLLDDLLIGDLEPDLRVPVLVQAAVAWHGLGSPEAALAFLARAEVHVGPDDAKERAWILHKRAGIVADSGELERALELIDAAIAGYAESGDHYGACGARSVRVRLMQRANELDDAKNAATELREDALGLGFERMHRHAKSLEGQLLVALGAGERGLAALEEVLAESIAAEDRAGQFFAHYHLWKAHEELGNQDRAGVERVAAEYFVRYIDASSPETLEVLAGADDGIADETTVAPGEATTG